MQPLPTGYLSSLNTLSQMSRQTVLKSVDHLLDRKTNIGLQNRYLFDAVQLISQIWKPDEDWDFTQVSKLSLPTNIKEVPKPLLVKFKKRLKDSSEETYQDFASLQEQATSEPFIDNVTYLKWFNKYVSYLVVGLETAQKDRALAQAMERLHWMLAQDPNGADSQLYDGLLSYGMRYIYAWYRQRSLT